MKILVGVLSFFFGTLCGLIISYLQYGVGKDQLAHELKSYRESQVPEIDFIPKYLTSSETHLWYLTNISNVVIDKIWAEEKVFLIDSSNAVYLLPEIPRFMFFVKDSSQEKIWSLDTNETIKFGAERLQPLAFWQIINRFKGKIVSQWDFKFSKSGSKKVYYTKKYFEWSDINRQFSETSTINVNLISGTPAPYNVIKPFIVTGDFEVNPPETFLVMRDYSILPLEQWTQISLKELTSAIWHYWPDLEIQPTNDSTIGTLKYNWSYKNGEWNQGFTMIGKGAQMYSKPIRMTESYLSDREQILLQTKPKLRSSIYNNLIRGNPPNDPDISRVLSELRNKYRRITTSNQNPPP